MPHSLHRSSPAAALDAHVQAPTSADRTHCARPAALRALRASRTLLWGHLYCLYRQAVKRAQALAKSGDADRMVEAAQRFAYRYLSPRSRALYYEGAVRQYNTLFGPGYMAATVAQLPADRPVTMDDILGLRMYPRGWDVTQRPKAATESTWWMATGHN